jgi:hypothetical protein
MRDCLRVLSTLQHEHGAMRGAYCALQELTMKEGESSIERTSPQGAISAAHCAGRERRL